MTPDPATVEAIDRLQNNPEFRVWRSWLEGQIAYEVERAVRATDGADVLRGRAQFGLDIIQMIQRNPDTVKRIASRRR